VILSTIKSVVEQKGRFALLLVAQLAGCQDATGPNATLVLSRPPDLTAVVVRSTHESGATPAGVISQYALWIGSSNARSADAGVVVGAAIPVFARSNGKLTRATAAAIAAGATIQIWRDGAVAYGAVEAPPGKPCYTGTQIVIMR
jgi:hypothetical protein